MKKLLIVAAAGALMAGQVAAQESPWLVRARAVHLEMANDTTGTVDSLGVHAENKWIPEVDISYFFNKNVAAELILTVPQKHTVYAGNTSLGTFKHLPPTLTLQYHFTNFNGFKPYVGAGVNYTKISSVNLNNGGTPLQLDNDSFGAAFQVGVDIPLDKKWSVNVDVKKVYIKTDVYNGTTGANLGTLKLDPILVGVGVGYRF